MGVDVVRGVVRRMGEPVVRLAVGRAMREMGAQFVLGRTIEEAMENGHTARESGFTKPHGPMMMRADTMGPIAKPSQRFRPVQKVTIFVRTPVSR